MIHWKNTSLPNAASLKIQHFSSTVRKRMEAGNTLQRQRYTKDYENGVLTFQLSDGEFRIFKGVWKHYLTNGTAWFLMDLPVGGIDVLTQSQVRFISDYSHKYGQLDNVDITVSIEFFEVETISEGDLGIIIEDGDVEAPYTTEGVGVIFDRVEGQFPRNVILTTTNYYSYFNVEGTQKFSTGLSGNTVPFPSTSSIEYRVDCWSCVANENDTPAGLLTEVRLDLSATYGATTQPIKKVDLRKAPSLENINGDSPNYNGMDNFEGTVGSNANTFDLHNRSRLHTVMLGYAPLINYINISHPLAPESVQALHCELLSFDTLLGVNLAGRFEYLKINDCETLTGNLDLSNVVLEIKDTGSLVYCYGNTYLTNVSLPTGLTNSLSFEHCDFLTTFVSAGDNSLMATNFYVRNTDFSIAGLEVVLNTLVDPTDPSNPLTASTVWFANTPADANITQELIDLAASKNITLSY